MALLGGWRLFNPLPEALTQWDIDNAVKYTLGHTPEPPADTTLAAAMVAPSVVRVDGYLSPEHAAALAKEEADEAQKAHIKLPPPDKQAEGKQAEGKQAAKDKDPSTKTPDGKPEEHPDSTGSGVVIDEKGDILTNLHVVSSTDRWVVTFADGSKSDATMVTSQPENDLAVIKAKVAARRSQARHPGLDPRSLSRRHGGGGRLSLRHRAVGFRRRGVGAEARIRRSHRQGQADS